MKNEILELMRKRNKAKEIANLSKDENDWNEYKKLRSRVTSTQRAAKRKIFYRKYKEECR